MRGAFRGHIETATSAAHGTTPGGGGRIAIVVVAVVLLGIVLFVVSWRPQSGRDDDQDVDSGPGGRGPDGPARPSGGPAPERGPVWWPEFEQQFAAHVELTRRAAPTPPAGADRHCGMRENAQLIDIVAPTAVGAPGYLHEPAAVREHSPAVRRVQADDIITYHANDAVTWPQ